MELRLTLFFQTDPFPLQGVISRRFADTVLYCTGAVHDIIRAGGFFAGKKGPTAGTWGDEIRQPCRLWVLLGVLNNTYGVLYLCRYGSPTAWQVQSASIRGSVDALWKCAPFEYCKSVSL